MVIGRCSSTTLLVPESDFPSAHAWSAFSTAERDARVATDLAQLVERLRRSHAALSRDNLQRCGANSGDGSIMA